MFLHQDLGLLLKVPTFPAAQGWLLVWNRADVNQSIGSNLCAWGQLGHSDFVRHLAAGQPKHVCPYTQSHPVEHMELPKNRWKYKSAVFCQNSESLTEALTEQRPCNCSALSGAV